MTHTNAILELQRQRMLLEIEYFTEKEAFRKLTESRGMARLVKRGDAWFPLRVGKSYYNSLNQLCIEVHRTADQDIEHNFEFGRPVQFFKQPSAQTPTTQAPTPNPSRGEGSLNTLTTDNITSNANQAPLPSGGGGGGCIICCSPSKSFNTAGLQMANIICADPETRRRIDRAININEVCDVNPFGIVALEAAYNESGQWLDELCLYLWDNYRALCHFFAGQLPQLQVCRLEGTYLPWVDVSALGIPVEQLCHRLLSEGRVWVNPGTMYGPQSGQGYIRLNIACPRSQLMEGLRRIKSFICQNL